MKKILPKVALLIESSRSYGREVLQGIAHYTREHSPWAFYTQERELHGGIPEWLNNWRGDGIIARIENAGMARKLLRVGCPVVDVLGNQTFRGIPGLDIDAREVARLAADFFLQSGFRHFAFYVKGSVNSNIVLTACCCPVRLWGMARKLRVEYAGAVYHVMNRGDRREPIFKDNEDRRRFLSTLGEACAKTGWQVHALCLMPNHFHLVVETPQANLVAGMKWFLGTYTSRFNRRHKVFGHLFSGRYKALIVEGSGNGYLKTVCDYVHLNPARAKLLTPEQRLREYPWSSWPEYLKSPGGRPAWLRVDRLLGEYRIPQDSAVGRRYLEEALEQRRRAEEGEAFNPIRRGWFLGGDALKQELLAQVSAKAGRWNYGEALQESAVAKAERIVREELQRRKWDEETLAARRKGDAVKLAVAQRLRRETTVTLDWIATRLWMGTRTHLAHLLYWERRRKE